MSNEKRYVFFFILTFAWILGVTYFLGEAEPKPAPKDLAKLKQADANGEKVAKKDDAAKDEKPKEKEKGVAAAPAKAAADPKAPGEPPALKPKPDIAHVQPAELVLGSASKDPSNGYLLEVQLTQKGAGVESIASALYDAEFEGQRPKPRKPLQLIQRDPKAPPSFGVNLLSIGDTPAAAEGSEADSAEIPLGEMEWSVVRDDKGRAARPVPADAAPGQEQGREVVFTTTVGDPAVILTKTYTLKKGANSFQMTLGIESPHKDRAVVYKLLGPHNIPIEGEWYTYTFRDAFFGQVEGGRVKKPVTRAAAEIVKKGKDNTEKFLSLPLKYAGIENQYFAVFFEPNIAVPTPEKRWDAETVGVVIHEKPNEDQKADIGIEMTSRPVSVGPNRPAEHSYTIFAGPKTFAALEPYGAADLASYRKTGWFGIPFAPEVASVISPALGYIYRFTKSVAGLFGGTRGNYGISIILLTLCVRMLMFPLGRKQALAAKKMQDLQPHLKELQEKYKEDKERQTKETFALYKRHGVNPVAGCIPALIQLPIFVGLWQALNTSVDLRQASFLWIKNLAAPDMLFRFPMEVPWLGPYFNLLPLAVVGLMLVQTKLFSPPATTPEAEMQQKMMKYMMVFMAVMFYKVPSGLGIYFITSSLWQIGERLLLPKVTAKPTLPGSGGSDNGPSRGGGGGPGGDSAPDKPKGKFAQFFDKVLEEAKKDATYRKVMGDGDDDQENRRRDRSKSRARPGRRR
jgi:YidC/Oxa1 family membrane protein insertase